MRKGILISFILCVFSCTQVEQDPTYIEKEENITSYLKNELNLSVPTNSEIVILQNQTCSSCRADVFHKLVDLMKANKGVSKIFILGTYDTVLSDMINKLDKSRIFIDKNNVLKDYGLNYSTDLFLLFSNNHLKKWFEISNNTLDTLKQINVN
jgi:hypothetical protein